MKINTIFEYKEKFVIVVEVTVFVTHWVKILIFLLSPQQIRNQHMTTQPPEQSALEKSLAIQKLSSKQYSDNVFRYLSQLIKNNSYITNIPKEQKKYQSLLLSNQKAIKPKMFTKVANWMEKMCVQTINFSYQTLQYSLKIMKQFLQISEESPKNLQMLGCVCLHIASKFNQKSIISIDSYIECCLNIFNRNEFEQKQAQVYEKVAWSTPAITLYDVSDFIQYEILSFMALSQNQQNILNKVIQESMKDLEFLEFDPFTFMINLWAEIIHKPQFQFQKQEFLTVLKYRKFQY